MLENFHDMWVIKPLEDRAFADETLAFMITQELTAEDDFDCHLTFILQTVTAIDYCLTTTADLSSDEVARYTIRVDWQVFNGSFEFFVRESG